MTDPVWLDVEEVLAIHDRQIGEFGGSLGLRDLGLLESALGIPLNRFACGKPSLAELAASYAFGISKNHPFVDGNKRVGFASSCVFLKLNGHRLIATEADATLKMLALAAGKLTEKQLAKWIAINLEKSK